MKREVHWRRRRRRLIATLVLLVALFLVLLLLSCCKVASDADDAMEGMTTRRIQNDDAYLLAKFMTARAGSDWADWAVMLVGEVVMNRVESGRFPDTIESVIYADNPVQFEEIYSSEWDDITPSAEYLDIANRLIRGERALGDKDMVFTGNVPEGTGTLISYYDRNTKQITYFCRG